MPFAAGIFDDVHDREGGNYNDDDPTEADLRRGRSLAVMSGSMWR